MIRRLLLFGASGDLAGRYLLPSLAALKAEGRLPDGFQVIGAATQDWDDEAFRRFAAERLANHAGELPATARDDLPGLLRYGRVDFDDPSTVAGLVGESRDPVAAYLAVPPGLFPTAVRALDQVSLPPGSRIVLEKPFGEDLAGAVELNQLLARVAGDAGEEALYRVDHVLGMATTQNLLGLRLANAVLAPLWNSARIEAIEIHWEETLALEGRAGYFDKAGTLKDVLQNHALQVLSLIAMEPPASLDQSELRDRMVEAVRAIRSLRPDEVAKQTRRARYTAGRIGDKQIPAYVDEEGVDPSRQTETFAEIALELDSERWAGTRFVLRGGKAMRRRRKGVVVRFRPVSDLPSGLGEPAPEELWIGIDGPNDITLDLTGTAAGPPLQLSSVELSAPPPESDLPAYSRVLLDVLDGDGALSVRGDEAEEAWRVMTPVLEGWAADRVAVEEYPAGSEGLPGPD
jgi:glucose-6-phosphate 1-dehydrogenase